MMCGWSFQNWIHVGCSFPTLILGFILYLNNDINCVNLGSHVANKNAAYKVSASLRYLSKAVFAEALFSGKKVLLRILYIRIEH